MLSRVTMNAIRSVLDADHLPYELADDHLRCRTLSPGGEWVVVAQWSDAQLAVYCVCSLNVPPARRAAVMELVTRANYGLRLGCFELDLDDGEVRFRASLDFEGTEPSSSSSVRRRPYRRSTSSRPDRAGCGRTRACGQKCR